MRRIIWVIIALIMQTESWAQDFIVPIVPNTPGNTSKIYKYTPGDGGIFYNTTGGNEWAIVNAGREDGDEDGACDSKLFNMKTGEISKIDIGYGRYLRFKNGSIDANILVGRIVAGNVYTNRAASYNRTTKKVTIYPDREDADGGKWYNGHLVGCTPDGHYAYGYYQGYLGKTEGDGDVPHDWWYRPLLVDTEKGEVIPIADNVLPRGGNMEAIRLTGISDDGRYVYGDGNWFMEGGASFIYDTQTKRCVSSVGNTFELTHGESTATVLARLQKKHPELISISGLSPVSKTKRTYRCTASYKDAQGNTASAMAIYFREVKGADDIADREEDIKIYNNIEDGGVSIEVIDDNGTCYGMTETGSPLRNFKILYDGKYWVAFNQLCKQRFGYDFYEVTGFERSGTIMGVSPDGHRLISFPDPMGESFCFDFGMTAHEACSTLDFLSSYSASPEDGSQFESMKSVEITFERPIRILGSGKNIHLYDSKGTEVAKGLSSSSALQFKSGSNNTVIATIRTMTLTAGEDYYFVIDAGTFATAKSDDCLSKEIRLHYSGRSGAVKMIKSIPEAGSELVRLDNESSYVILQFDRNVKVTDNAVAYIQHEDGTYVGTMTMVAGYLPETKSQVLFYPISTINLFDGQHYKLIVEAGSICDYSENSKSYNEKIEVEYIGKYVRPVPTGHVLFQDSWDDIAESLNTWLRYEGDHNTPQYTPSSWGFDADNQPWNFSIRESNENPDYCAGSHSMYAPSNQSDDWMMTPQINMPAEGKTVLEFDAQSYYENTNDILDIYVYEDERVIGYLNDNNMAVIKQNAVNVFNEKMSPGATMEGLANEWTHYTVDLSAWNGKDIYIAFVNQNRNQSAIFVDNVLVQREVLYNLALDYNDRVVAQTEQKISGKLTVVKDEEIKSVSLILRNSEGNEVSRIEWNNISGNIKDRAIPFAFQNMLPLTIGKTNAYSIDITIGQHEDTYKGTIIDLAFKPQKRVVLEEMTGVDCPNCPLGILMIEKLRKQYGDLFIPISLHTYTGDAWGYGVMDYSNGLGLIAAPSARIDRTKGIYYPMASTATAYLDTNPQDPLWADVVAQQLNKAPLCNFNIASTYTSAKKDEVKYTANVEYAIDAESQQLSLLFVVLEDGLVNYQQNGFGQTSEPLLKEWGQGGTNSDGYVYPFTHNDVARSVVGSNYGGTIGLLPTTYEASKTVSATTTQTFPSNVMNKENAHVVGMLIDTQTGEVVNAAECKFADYNETDGIEDITTQDGANPVYYNIKGQRINKPIRGGVYIINGKKVLLGE